MESEAQLTDMDEKKRDTNTVRSSLKWMGAGIEFCGVVSVFAFFGYLLDAHFHTSPWLFHRDDLSVLQGIEEVGAV